MPRSMHYRRWPTRFAIGLILGLALQSGEGGSAAFAGTAARDAVVVQVGFTWSSGQYYSMFLVGRDKGIYAKHGLDVEFREGQGSASSAQIVANKKADFGIAIDPGSTVRVAAQGGKIKMIGQNIPWAPMAVLSKAPNQIRRPQDLIGKKIGLPPGTTQSQLFPAFLKINKIDPNSLAVINTQAATMQASLAQGQIDGFVSFAHSQLPILRGMGVSDPHAMLFADFGLRFAPGEGIIVQEDVIQSKPDLVRRFLAAIEETLRYAVDHYDEVAEAGLKAYPQVMKREVILAQVQFQSENIKKSRLPGKPLVWMQEDDWKALIELLATYADLKNLGPPSSYYTNEFAPAG